MKLKNIIKFLEPFNDVVIHVHYRELDNSISCDEYAYEGFVENIPWTMLEYELYNDSKYAELVNISLLHFLNEAYKRF